MLLGLVVLILDWVVLGYLGILLEVLEWNVVPAASEVFVVLKAGLLGLILFVLSFPKAVIHRLVRLLILEGFVLLGVLRCLRR